MDLIQELQNNIDLVEKLPSEGYVISVAGKYVCESDSNTGWGLVDFPKGVIPMKWIAQEVIDDIVLTHNIHSINLQLTTEYKEEALSTMKTALECLINAKY
jgi:hypothetical protein